MHAFDRTEFQQQYHVLHYMFLAHMVCVMVSHRSDCILVTFDLESYLCISG